VGQFFTNYFGFQPSLAQIIWTVVIASMIGAYRWIMERHPTWRRWFLPPFVVVAVFVVLGAISFATSNGTHQPKPNLSTSDVTWGYGGQREAHGSGEGANVLVYATIINSGDMPSITRDYKMTAQVGDRVFPGEMAALPPRITLTYSEGPTSVLSGGDALYEKTEPIPVGGMTTGILGFAFRDLKEGAFGPGTVFTLTFADALGQTYTHREVLTAPSARLNPGRFPRLHQEIIPQQSTTPPSTSQ
jgi:hypothetical protein